MKKDNFAGFSLFNDLEDVDLKNRNRAVVLCNILESNLDRKTKKANVKGVNVALNYFNLIPDVDKDDVNTRFLLGMKERGFVL